MASAPITLPPPVQTPSASALPAASFATTHEPTCAGCRKHIDDEYVLSIMHTHWHTECLKCSQCDLLMDHKCFERSGQLFCKEDYYR